MLLCNAYPLVEALHSALWSVPSSCLYALPRHGEDMLLLVDPGEESVLLLLLLTRTPDPIIQIMNIKYWDLCSGESDQEK